MDGTFYSIYSFNHSLLIKSIVEHIISTQHYLYFLVINLANMCIYFLINIIKNFKLIITCRKFSKNQNIRLSIMHCNYLRLYEEFVLLRRLTLDILLQERGLYSLGVKLSSDNHGAIYQFFGKAI